jgi:hypothetical protein
MLSPKAWNWEAKTGFFWAGACALLFSWSYFRLPEPKGRTYGELDVLFEQRISARDFSTTRVDKFQKEKTELHTMDPAVMMTPMSSAESGKQIRTKHEEERNVVPEA